MWRFLPPRNFIFFPKVWLIRASLDKKLVESIRPGRKIGKFQEKSFFTFLGIYLFSEGLAHKNRAKPF
ncbi:hypothetical protein BFC23_05495 [Carnobacterium maltaromaticum]|jgi:hypothetical protein|nr:hypothetical protein BFC23_05495 [Carnobacterium maltaromaticum]